MLENFGNLAGAEFLYVRAFLGFFFKISTPELCNGDPKNAYVIFVLSSRQIK